MNNYVLLIFWLTLNSCATIKITSNPSDAEVTVQLPGISDAKILGKTPFTASLDELFEKSDAPSVVLLVKKEGFSTEKFIIPNFNTGDFIVDISLENEKSNRVKSIQLTGNEIKNINIEEVSGSKEPLQKELPAVLSINELLNRKIALQDQKLEEFAIRLNGDQLELDLLKSTKYQFSGKDKNIPFRIFLKAYEYIENNRYEEAMQAIKSMKDMVPEIAAPYYLEGMIDLAKGNENKALQSFEEMKQRDPDDPLVDDLIKMLKASN